MTSNINVRSKAARPAHVPEDRVHDIDMYALNGIEEGYHEAWKRIQKPGTPKLVWTPRTGGHWIAMTGDAVKEIYADPSRFSSHVIFLPKEAGEKYSLVPTRMDPPEHTPYRSALDKGLNLGAIRKVEDKVRQIAADLIESIAAKNECDFNREYAEVFPIKVFMALADLPMTEVPYLSRLARQMTRPEGNTPEEQAATLENANRGFFEYVEPIIHARRGGTGDDLISRMVNSTINGEPMPHDKALGLVSLLLLGGLDTVVNFLGFSMLYLARHPKKQVELRSDPTTLLRGVEEFFRRFSVVSEARMVAKDMEYDGVQLKQGDMILMPTVFAGIDETLAPNAWELDFTRQNQSHATFGGGPHRCAGLHLARLEMQVTLQEWLKRIPEFREHPDSKPVYASGIVANVSGVRLAW